MNGLKKSAMIDKIDLGEVGHIIIESLEVSELWMYPPPPT